MRNKFILLLPILAASTLTGCSKDNRTRITYGSPTISAAIELTYEQLATKMTAGENMILVTYHQEYSPSCECWKSFKPIIDAYADANDTYIYQIDRTLFVNHEDFGFTMMDSSNPTLIITKEGKKQNEYLYSKNNTAMFTTADGFKKALDKVIKAPQFIVINSDYLDNKLLKSNDSFVVYYHWSFCPDCTYCMPNVLMPYSQNNNFSTKFYCIDLAVPGILMTSDNKWPEEGTAVETYVTFLKNHHLSLAGDEKFGYDRGFVPTFQYYKGGELTDMSVYFNDKVEQVDGKYKITRSYYTQERVKNLTYTDTVLEGLEIPESEMQDGSWKQEAMAAKHDPILKAFLNKYVK
ncbi:MAG: hypothetical protein K6F07_03875 [Bacilli bacterium]|nr:hypothetical protein [Bacilli bacterium]